MQIALIISLILLAYVTVLLAKTAAAKSRLANRLKYTEQALADAEQQVAAQAEGAVAATTGALPVAPGSTPIEPAGGAAPFHDVSGSDAEALVQKNGLSVLDVRTPGETERGIIPGARLLPLDQLADRIGELDSESEYLVYCAGGARSIQACEILASNGFKNLHNLAGGFGGWTGVRSGTETAD